MKSSVVPASVDLCALLLAIPGAVARFWLHAAEDAKGLLPTAHPGDIGSMVLTVVAIAVLLFLSRNLYIPIGPVRPFPASWSSTAGAAAGILGIGLATGDAMTLASGSVRLVMVLLGIAATVCAVLLALCRSYGFRPVLLLRSVIIVFFMLYLVLLYRTWSAEPQLQRYLFQLLALLCVAAANYYRACVECKRNQTKELVFSSQLAVFLCILAVPESNLQFCYMALAVWMALDTYDPVPVRRRRPVVDPEA